MKDKLEVFISSAQSEFEKERTTLAQRISKMPFLVCNPLEKRGAESVPAIEASLQGVRDCDIYIGIFGSRYSETTKAEFREAMKHYKMCLNYAKRVKSREEQLQEFLEAELKPQFKYHKFSKSKDLHEQIEEDLNRHLLRLLRLGLDNFKMKKRRAIETGRTEQQQIRTAILRKEEDRPLAMVMEARSAYSSEDYLTAAIKAAVAVELALRFALLRRGISGRELRLPLGHLLQFALRTEVLSKQDLTDAKNLRYVRNAALHDGRTPLKEEALVAIKLAENLIQKLRE